MTEGFPAPEQGLIVTHFLTVRDVLVSREFYADIFGGHVVLSEDGASYSSREKAELIKTNHAAFRPVDSDWGVRTLYTGTETVPTST